MAFCAASWSPALSFAADGGPHTLFVNVYPTDAHVYLEPVEPGSCDAYRCTGWCTLRMQEGRYIVRAGLRHDALGTGDELALTAPIQTMTVRVAERTAFRYAAVGGVGLGLVGLISTLIVRWASGTARPVGADAPYIAAISVSGGLLAVGVTFGVLWESPSVDVTFD